MGERYVFRARGMSIRLGIFWWCTNEKKIGSGWGTVFSHVPLNITIWQCINEEKQTGYGWGKVFCHMFRWISPTKLAISLPIRLRTKSGYRRACRMLDFDLFMLTGCWFNLAFFDGMYGFWLSLFYYLNSRVLLTITHFSLTSIRNLQICRSNPQQASDLRWLHLQRRTFSLWLPDRHWPRSMPRTVWNARWTASQRLSTLPLYEVGIISVKCASLYNSFLFSRD